MTRAMLLIPAYLFVFAYAYAGILIISHWPEVAMVGGIMLYAAGLIAGVLIAHPLPGQSNGPKP